MGKESTIVLTEQYTKGSGERERKMGKESNIGPVSDLNTKVSGKMVIKMGKGSRLALTEAVFRDPSNVTNYMEEEFSIGLMEIGRKEAIRMICLMGGLSSMGRIVKLKSDSLRKENKYSD